MSFYARIFRGSLLGAFFVCAGAFAQYAYAAAPAYTVEVLTPVAGVSLRADAVAKITWNKGEGDAPFADLFYSEDSGATWNLIVKGTLNDGSYPWTVAHVQSEHVAIKIVTTDLATDLVSDVSEEFSIFFYAEDNAPYWNDGAAPLEEVLEEVDGITAGDFVQVEGSDVISYIDDGMVRRPLRDEETLFTYKNSSDDVLVISENTFHKFALGAPLAPKAGVVLIKTPSFSRVYWADEREGKTELHWITSEDIAKEMFGDDWKSYIFEVDSTLFTRYEIGTAISTAYPIAVEDMKQVSELHD